MRTQAAQPVARPKGQPNTKAIAKTGQGHPQTMQIQTSFIAAFGQDLSPSAIKTDNNLTEKIAHLKILDEISVDQNLNG
jgi:hypothetical protein